MTMTSGKQELLEQFRRKKRLALGIGAGLFLIAGIGITWWIPIPLALLGWIAHEAWFSDHFFYPADADYRYDFGDAPSVDLLLRDGQLSLNGQLPSGDTYILELRIISDWRSRFLDPHVIIGGERFDFEHAAKGRRFIDLSKHAQALADRELTFKARYCRIDGEMRLTAFRNADFTRKRLMILAPHADDAELAAFGVYRHTHDVLIVTLTQGETEAEDYLKLGLDLPSCAQLKGRLRAWDSIAIPLWGGVAPENCLQLGYYGMQLAGMRKQPDSPLGSRISGNSDIREVRGWNKRRLPSDGDGSPTWNNLIADLAFLLDDFHPEAVITPHPRIDPHPDHVATTQALKEAAKRSQWKFEAVLFYANHLHDNDRWPMGPAGEGITLPPVFNADEREAFWSLRLPPEMQIDKAMALAMHHDLMPRIPLKKRIRRHIQALLAGRQWPPTGENEFFRKAVRSSELFHVRLTKDFLS